MHHLNANFTGANLTETSNGIARRHHRALRRTKVEKTQSDSTASISDLNHQHALFAVLDIGIFYFALNTDMSKGAAIGDSVNTRAVFVSQRQMKQHILYRSQAQFLKLFRYFGTHTF